MKSISCVALGLVTVGAMFAGSTPAQATTVPDVPRDVRLIFVPKTVVKYKGKYCRGTQTQAPAIASSSKGALGLATSLDIGMRVKKPHAKWARTDVIYGPNDAFLTYPGIPRDAFGFETAKKAGTYEFMFRLRDKVLTNPDDLLDGQYVNVYGAWSSPLKIKVTKKQLKKISNRVTKQSCPSD
jgi:hypothetical protein